MTVQSGPTLSYIMGKNSVQRQQILWAKLVCVKNVEQGNGNTEAYSSLKAKERACSCTAANGARPASWVAVNMRRVRWVQLANNSSTRNSKNNGRNTVENTANTSKSWEITWRRLYYSQSACWQYLKARPSKSVSIW